MPVDDSDTDTDDPDIDDPDTDDPDTDNTDPNPDDPGTGTDDNTGTDPDDTVQRAGFTDVVAGSTHADDIDGLYAAGITRGCNQDPLRYCPNDPVTRAQMAAFLARALKLSAAQSAGFTDVVAGSTHADDINALYAAGVTRGCSQDPLRYCPNDPVTRAQMAAFLARALKLSAAQSAGFTDVVAGSTHADDINALYAAGVTRGCSQVPLRFCPNEPVTRAQMASFLVRALDLPTPASTQQPSRPTVSSGNSHFYLNQRSAPRNSRRASRGSGGRVVAGR